MLRVAALLATWVVLCSCEGAAAATGAPLQTAPPASPAPNSAVPADGAAPVPSISGHFSLQTLDGREVTDATYRGKWLLVYFGYTSCPDICPTVLLRVGQALDSLGSLADRIQPIFITVDPSRDSASRLKQYMAAFNPHIVGLRGDPQEVGQATREFHVYYRKRDLGNGEYTVDHSSFLYVVTPEGRFQKLLQDSLPADTLAAELRTLVTHFANADDAAKVAAGKLVYQRWCAGCHGRRLQGQPLWQLDDLYAGRRAPAHDQSGHTWAHSDEDLFYMVRNGRFPSTSPSATSYMPAYSDSLADQQIIEAIAFIKATWPIGLRISQALLNPDNAGMPAHAAEMEWTLPPTCTISTQRWRTTSQ
jgi:protein SCO1/2